MLCPVTITYCGRIHYIIDVYIRTIYKKNKNSDKVYNYYRIIHAYRIGDKRRHINILKLVKLEDSTKDKHKLLADRTEEILTGKESLFPNLDKPEYQIANCKLQNANFKIAFSNLSLRK